MGQDPKSAQVALHQGFRTTSLKRTVVSDNQTFEGKGDTFHTAKWTMTDYQNPHYCSPSEGSIPKSEGDNLRESLKKYHRIGSSGLNLTCQGLLLGMRDGGHRDSGAELTLACGSQ
jgi:hypothetical protein